MTTLTAWKRQSEGKLVSGGRDSRTSSNLSGSDAPIGPNSTYKKVCLMGDFAVGKSSLVRRFVNSVFDDRYVSTVGVRVSLRAMDVPGAGGDEKLTIVLWDLAGCDELRYGLESYLHGMVGGVLVCDLTRPETLARVRECAEVMLRASPGVQLILAANKYDLADQCQLDLSRVEAVAASLNIPYYLTSAKTGEGVEMLFRHLVRLVVAQL